MAHSNDRIAKREDGESLGYISFVPQVLFPWYTQITFRYTVWEVNVLQSSYIPGSLKFYPGSRQA